MSHAIRLWLNHNVCALRGVCVVIIAMVLRDVHAYGERGVNQWRSPRSRKANIQIWQVELKSQKFRRAKAVSAPKTASPPEARGGWSCLGPAAAAMVGAMGLTRKATCHSLMSAAPIDETDVVRARLGIHPGPSVVNVSTHPPSSLT